jgi:hypothetical protein
MAVTFGCTSAPFVRYGEKLKLSGDSGNEKCKQGHGGACGGAWRSLASGGQFCVGALGRNLASVGVKIFSHLIYFIEEFNKFCTLMRFVKIMLQ